MKGFEEFKGLSEKSILMVDDEEVVIDMIREVVGPAVSKLEIAVDGVDALLKIMERDFDFILLDIKMPKMNGIELYSYIKSIKPHLLGRIIFITGDTVSEAIRGFIAGTGCKILDKPFMIKDLLNTMTEFNASPVA